MLTIIIKYNNSNEKEYNKKRKKKDIKPKEKNQ